MNMIKHVFGPVASRRLGISLGVDIIPFKTCTLDCLYCECGRTTDLTIERKSFVDPQLILGEIKEIITRDPHIEYITFSGSGEPTLNIDIGNIITGIKTITTIPIAILTNGTLLHRETVRKEIANADVVCPSLDAAAPETFAVLNRPHKGLTINTIINGLIDFRKAFRGEIWLEVFIAKGINDSDHELGKIYQAIKKIRPDKVQLNSLDRPPACEHIYPVDIDMLEQIVKKWKDLPMPVEIIKRIRRREEIAAFSHNLENNILNTINRRPLTINDLVTLTGKNRLEIFKYIDVLEKEKKIYPKIVGDKIFYAPISRYL
ncbi:MAG: radical SAM protein [Candidatus Aminicenantes bacterium]|nr:radical SAM protein [Candidatus Aminicenantes bacterium]